jgi:hypothetical protein
MNVKGHPFLFFEVPLGTFFNDKYGRRCFKNGENTYKRDGSEFEVDPNTTVYVEDDEYDIGG